MDLREPPPPADRTQSPTRRRPSRLGRLRRRRDSSQPAEPVQPARRPDEEYVGWVSALGDDDGGDSGLRPQRGTPAGQWDGVWDDGPATDPYSALEQPRQD